MVNLGPDGYLDGRKGADGHEPILDFGFHVPMWIITCMAMSLSFQ